MTKKGIITLLLILFVVVAMIIFLVSRYGVSPYVSSEDGLVTSFEKCVLAGYPVMESYPRQCRVPSGELFVESVTNPVPDTTSNPTTDPTPAVKGGCYVGGCSAQICSDEKDVASTCEFRQEYACYKTATCERQASGQCGWTPTQELAACLNNPPNL